MNATTHDPSGCDIDALNSLLRGELSAVETYTQAMGRLEDPVVIADLQKIREEHDRAERELRDRVVWLGGKPAESTGPWGAFVATAAGGAKVLGPATALAALRQGEEQAIGEYEAALGNEGVHPDCHRLIRTDLLPACRRHVEELNRLLGGMTTG
jgi:hypothetical protein